VPEWSADFVVDEGLARRLLRQFPELEIESLRPFAEGWDYAIWLVNETWAFRFPRREICIPGIEIEVLPSLAPLLPIPVPAAVFVGQPSEEFPWPFFGAPLLAGRELAEAALDEDARVGVARSLGTFLRHLHDAAVPHALPIDQNRRSDMQIRVPIARDQLRELEEAGLWRRAPAVDEILNEAERLPPSEPTAVVHGDLHFRQLLVDEGAQVTGVIDWVDLGRSDAAIDLSLYWSYFPPAARDAFLDSYGSVTEEQLLRARVLALWLGAVLSRYGHVERNLPVRDEALAGLDRTAPT
jgi:aminoglycoside phosphotransferase (APT) family kinase protein